jgi:hypothetical protein
MILSRLMIAWLVFLSLLICVSTAYGWTIT